MAKVRGEIGEVRGRTTVFGPIYPQSQLAARPTKMPSVPLFGPNLGLDPRNSWSNVMWYDN